MGLASCLMLVTASGLVSAAAKVPAGGVLRVHVADAVGSKTVLGQLTVAGASGAGFVTAFACDAGPPTDKYGRLARSDLNYWGAVAPSWSNRLIVQADDDGDICFLTTTEVHLVIDVNAVSFDTGITSFANRRTDTRTDPAQRPAAGEAMQLHIPEANGAKTVVGQLTVANATDAGHVTAFPCSAGAPVNDAGKLTRSDLNYWGHLAPTRSNRLIVQADDNGNVCFLPHTAVDLVIDINGVSDTGIFSFPTERTDTRAGAVPTERLGSHQYGGTPIWAPYEPAPPTVGNLAPLTGRPAVPAIALAPIVAVKIDNYKLARPQWGLDSADVVIEVEAEGVSRFIALFHSKKPVSVGPVRSARTGDLDLLTAMNRPIFTYSGANPGVTAWITAAAAAGLLRDHGASHHGCYSRHPSRPGPHNLGLTLPCAIDSNPTAGPAQPLWAIADNWDDGEAISQSRENFEVAMPGVTVAWSWDDAHGVYRRSQDHAPHLAANGVPITASTVVVLSADYIPSPVDERSPHPVTVGGGTASIHREGREIPVLWERPSGLDPFAFRTLNGVPVELDVGTTWLEVERRP